VPNSGDKPEAKPAKPVAPVAAATPPAGNVKPPQRP
jgi:hypothetical protein